MSFASKKLGLIAAMAATAVCSSAMAANNMGWYITPSLGVSLGVSVVPDIKLDGDSGTKLESKTGFNGSLAVGMSQGPMSYEVEALYIQAKLDKLKTPIGDFNVDSGKTKVMAGMVNAYYNFEQANTPFVPYVGLGIGYARVKQEGTIGGQGGSASANAFAYQGKLGVNYKIDDAMGVGLGYTYFGTNKADYSDHGDDAGKERVSAHNFALSLKWMF